MNKIFLSLFIGFLTFNAFAQIPNGYYNDAQGLSGAQLKTALSNIIDNHNVQSYDALWIHFESTDPKPNGKVWDMYSDVPGGTPPYEFNFGDDQCGNYGGEGDCYNREHSFPKSWFNDASPMYTDLFQVVPSDGYVNGQRSNWPYGAVNSPSWTSMNGSKVGSNSTSGYSGTVFEPIDEYKGDFARIYFYMATRYEDRIANWENNSSNADAALDGTTFPCYEDWYLNLLLDWHSNDPVSQKEIDRNNEIYDIQDNRNPYVDHPEYVNQVWGGTIAPSITNVDWTPAIPDEDEAVTVSANITDDGSIASAQLNYGFTSTSLNQTMSMSASGNNFSAEIPGQDAEQNVYFRIVASDNESNSSQSAIYNYQVNGGGTSTLELPFLEDFNDETLGIFNQYSVTGSGQYWHNDDFNDTYYAKMSNYDGDNNLENEDWLITPAINFDNYNNEKLSFISSMKDFNDNSTFIYLKYSTNYIGSGNPNNANWIDLSSQANWSSGNYEWIASGDIDLSSISGTSVYIAFVYESQDGSGKTWQIDDVSITIDGTNEAPEISNIEYSPDNPEENEIVTVSAEITDDGAIDEALLLWGFSTSNLSESILMNSSADNYTANIPGQSAETTVYFKISATDNGNLSSESQIFNYSVQALPNEAPQISNIDFQPENPVENEIVIVSANISDDVEVSNAMVNWGYTISSLNNSVSMSESGNIFEAIIPGQSEETTVYFSISATDNENETTESSVYQYTVQSNPNQAPEIENIDFVPVIPGENETVNVSADITDDEEVSIAQIIWGYSADNLNNSVDMSNSSDTYSGTIPGQAAETIVYFKVQATDNESESSISGLYQYQVAGSSNLPPQISNVNFEPQEPYELEDVSVTAIINDDSEVSFAKVFWGLSESNLVNELNMVQSSNMFTTTIPGQDANLTVYFKVVATDDEDESSESEIFEYTVQVIPNENPLISNIEFSPLEPNNEQEVIVNATITDDGEIEVSELHYGPSPSQMNEIIDMTSDEDIFSATIPAQQAGQTIYFQIYAIDNESASTYSAIQNYYVDLAEGIEETPNSRPRIYPNPSSNYIVVRTDQTQNIQIIHSSGKILREIENYQSGDRINVSQMNKGYYLLRIQSDDDTKIEKLIIQ